MIVFPSIQRVLLTVSANELEKLCKNDNLAVVCKAVPDNPQWKEKAKVTIMSCLWQMAIWTASGRLIYPMTPQTVFTLKRWPKLNPFGACSGIYASVGISDEKHPLI